MSVPLADTVADASARLLSSSFAQHLPPEGAVLARQLTVELAHPEEDALEHGAGPGGEAGGARAELWRVYDDYEAFVRAFRARRWDAYLPAAFRERRDAFAALLERLDAVRVDEIEDEEEREEERVNVRVLRPTLRQAVDEFRFRPWLYATTARGGMHTSFSAWCKARRFVRSEDPARFEAAAASYARDAAQLVEAWRDGLAEGRSVSRHVAVALAKQLRAQVTGPPEESAFLAGARAFASKAFLRANEGASDRLARAVRDVVYPAVRAMATFLEDELAPAARDEDGLHAVPDGGAYFAHLVRTASGLSPEEAFQMGADEVERLEVEITDLCRLMGVRAASFASLTSVLESDKRLFFKPGEDMVASYCAVLDRAVPHLRRAFRWMPRAPLRIRTIKSSAKAPAMYSSSATRPELAVNVFRPGERPRYMTEAIALHEAVGHHVQLSRAASAGRAATRPAFRRRRGVFLAYTEGWALYCEKMLGERFRLYSDKMQRLGQLNGAILRAARMVVAVGVHHRRWTRREARDWMQAHTVLSQFEVDSEVERAVLAPGRGTAYTPGALKFEDLLRRAEARLGRRFSLPEFHEAVMRNGAVPLDLLDELVSAWVERRARCGEDDAPPQFDVRVRLPADPFWVRGS